jgi:hypothetical protein
VHSSPPMTECRAGGVPSTARLSRANYTARGVA